MENWPDKMERVRRNVGRMLEFGAPETDIDQYLGGESVTSANMRQYGAVAKSREELATKPNALQSFGRGMTDIVMGAGQLTGNEAATRNALSYLPGGDDAGQHKGLTNEQAATQENADIALYEKNQGGGFDLPRLAGQFSATAPLGFGPAATAGLAARTTVGAATGAGAGALVYADQEGERLTNVVGGALGGGVFGAAAPKIAEGAGALFKLGKDTVNKVSGLLSGEIKIGAQVSESLTNAATNAGIPLDEIGEAYTKRVAHQAQQALDNSQPFDYDAALRQARAEQFGFVDDAAMMRGQATRDPKIFSTERNLAKRPEGAPIAERLNNQLAVAEQRMDELAKMPDLDPITAGDAMRDLAGAKAESLQEVVRAAYRSVPGGGNFSRESLADRTAQILSDHQDDVSSGVKRRIQELIDPDSNRAFTGDELIKLDKLITDTMPPDPLNAARGRAAGLLKESVLGVMDDVAETSDAAIKAAYTQAKAAAKERFDLIGPHNGLTAQLVHGTVDPSQVVSRIAGGRVDDLRRLRKFMDDNQWQTIQRSIENYIVEGARPGGEFSQAAYDRVIKRLGKERLSTIFGGEKAKQLIDFRDVARDVFRYPNLHTVNTSNTAPEGANIVRDVGMGLLDFMPGGRLTTGLLGRMFDGGAQRKAGEKTHEVVMGLLSDQPMPVPVPNPALPALPYVRSLSPSAGLLGSTLLGQ